MSVYLKHVRNRVIVKGVERSGKVWLGEPIEETRQEYANARIWEYQRHYAERGREIPFAILLSAFVGGGMEYDHGYRLRDLTEGAA